MRKFLNIISLTCLLVVFSGCAEQLTQDDLSERYIEWQKMRPDDYSIEYIKQCDCELANVIIEVTVNGDNVKYARTKDSGNLVSNPVTIDSLFEQLLSTVPHGSIAVQTIFDENHSYPKLIEIKNSMSIHDTITIEIVNFSFI